MTEYIIAEIDVTDPETYKNRYAPLVPASLEGYGGFLVRGGKTESLEGEPPKRIVILSFPDMDKARSWYKSEGYAKAKLIRQGASVGRLYIVEG